ncbi:MAG: hypothetical protein HUJ25_11800 [Crocinitomicaceae bacterium]|nr:hypothetical protein [Crocinitomicaceae bacterium]
MKRLLIITYFLCYACIVQAQNYSTYIQKILNKIESSEGLHIKSKVYVYDNPDTKKLLKSFNAELLKSGNVFRNHIDDAEVISNEQFIYTIDHTERIIYVQRQVKLSRKDKKLIEEFNELNKVDSLKSQVFSKNSDQITFLVYPHGEIQRAFVTIDIKLLKFIRVEYYYDEERYPSGNYVVIDYEDFNSNFSVKEELLEGKDILKKSGNKFETTQKYSDYKVVNYYKEQ